MAGERFEVMESRGQWPHRPRPKFGPVLKAVSKLNETSDDSNCNYSVEGYFGNLTILFYIYFTFFCLQVVNAITDITWFVISMPLNEAFFV